MRILLVAAALVAPALAHADQCALNDAKVNANAAKLVTVGARVLEFCEPCREKTPGKPYTVKSIEVKNRQVFVNGRGQDLAYFYVERGKDEFKNVGALAGCGPEFVSLSVHDGKPSGAGKAPPSPARPVGPGVPGSPPPMNAPRVSSADELAGTWNVKLTTWLTTCQGKAPADQTWDIAIANGAFSITTSDGIVLEGPASSLTYGTFQHTLAPRQHPSSMTLKLSHGMRDRFYGTLIVGTPTGNPADPVCVTQLNVGGARKP